MEPISLNRKTQKAKTEKEIVNWSMYNFQVIEVVELIKCSEEESIKSAVNRVC